MVSSRTDFTRIDLVILGSVVALIAVVAIPGVARSRMAGNEAAAMASLRAIVSAEGAYAAACGQNRYTGSLRTLGMAPPGSTEGFLTPELAVAAPQTHGYRYVLRPGLGAVAGPADCHGLATTTGYYAAAAPLRFRRTGARAFAVDTAGVIWQAPAAAAPLEPFAAPATPIQ